MIRAAAIVLCLLAAAFAASPEYPCTYTDSNDVDYDLSGMYVSSSGTDYSLAVPENMEVFYVNVCGDTHDGCEDDKHAGNCQLAADGNYYPCGDASKGQFEDYPDPMSEGVQLIYPDGQPCNGVPRTSTLNIKCDSSAGTGDITGIDESVSCHYTIAMSSKYACPGASSGGGSSGGGGGGGFPWGWTIIGITIGLFILYLIIGAVVKWKVYGAEPWPLGMNTLDLIPNLEFWKVLPFLCYDGCKYTIRKITFNRVCGEYSEI